MIKVDYEQQRAVEYELQGGEKLLWVGRPAPGRLTLQTIPIVLFGIPWTAFALFWMWGASGFGKGLHSAPGPFIFFPLFGLPFVLIGLGMLTAPLWAFRSAANTIYAITDKRLLILTGKMSGSRSIKSYTAQDIGNIERNERSNGTGDILFARNTTYNSNAGRSANTSSIGFYGIPDARSVEKLIVDTFKTPHE